MGEPPPSSNVWIHGRHSHYDDADLLLLLETTALPPRATAGGGVLVTDSSAEIIVAPSSPTPAPTNNNGSNKEHNHHHHHHHHHHHAAPGRLVANFVLLSILFAANHGCVVACLGLATARLGSTTGAWQSGLL